MLGQWWRRWQVTTSCPCCWSPSPVLHPQSGLPLPHPPLATQPSWGNTSTVHLLYSAIPWACHAAAAAKSLQSCLTLCNPIDSSPPGSAVPGILQARTLEWVAVSFSSAWKWKGKVKLLSRVWLLATPWTAAYQAPPSTGFSREEYWSGLPTWKKSSWIPTKCMWETQTYITIFYHGGQDVSLLSGEWCCYMACVVIKWKLWMQKLSALILTASVSQHPCLARELHSMHRTQFSWSRRKC